MRSSFGFPAVVSATTTSIIALAALASPAARADEPVGICPPGTYYYAYESAGQFCCSGPTTNHDSCPSPYELCAVDAQKRQGHPLCPAADACDGKGVTFDIDNGGFCCDGTVTAGVCSVPASVCAIDPAHRDGKPLCCAPGLTNFGSSSDLCCAGAVVDGECAAGDDATCAMDAATAGTTPLCANAPQSAGALTTKTWLTQSYFRAAWDWATNERMWLLDLDGDGRDDVVGFDNTGHVFWSRGLGDGFAGTAQYGGDLIFRVAYDWFRNDENRLAFFEDMTGDGLPDVVGIDYLGQVWVSENTGSGFEGSHIVGDPIDWTAANGYFAIGEWPHVQTADMNGDGKTDLVGIDPLTGAVQVLVTGGDSGSYEFELQTYVTSSSLVASWFATTQQPRVFVADFTGDGAAEIVVIDPSDGALHVLDNTVDGNGDHHLVERTSTLQTPFRDDRHWFDTVASGTATARTSLLSWYDTHAAEHLFVADVNGDGKQDLVGIDPMAGQFGGDIWAFTGGGANGAAALTPKVMLGESKFKTQDGWFAVGSHPRVWVRDVTGDGRADVVGVDTNGDVWVARSASDVPSVSGGGAARDFLMPAVKTGTSGLTSAFFAGDGITRVFVGDPTGDGASDLVAIAPPPPTSSTGQPADGALLWHMAAPAQIEHVTPVTKAMLASGDPETIEVTLSRSVSTTSFTRSALTVRQNGATILPSSVELPTGEPKVARFDVTFATPGSGTTRVDVGLAAGATDRWNGAIDGDGDGAPGGLTSRRLWWNASLVAGAARFDLTPANTSGIQTSAGFGFEANGSPAYNADFPSAGGTNPMRGRVLVVAGGGACPTNTCFDGQTCVEGMCQNADGVDANQPLVIATLDLVGFNTTRVAELIAARYGIPKANVIVSATHAHGVFRTLRLFTMPYLDDRQAGTPTYEPWIEDRLAEAVGWAMRDMTPVTVESGSKTSMSEGFERRWGPGVFDLVDPANRMSVIALKSGSRLRAMLVAYALHPVLVANNDGIDADFPGWLRKDIESANCSGELDPGCVAMFMQGGAGDVNPFEDDSMSNRVDSRDTGDVIAEEALALTLTSKSTSGAQIRVRQGLTSRVGRSSCNACSDMGSRFELTTAVWTALHTAVSVEAPTATTGPVLRFGTLPGEAYSGLQTQLMSDWPSGEVAPLLFAYTNGYLGYLPDQGQLEEDAHGSHGHGWSYGMDQCHGSSQVEGPTFFVSTLGTATFGDTMVTALRGALADLRE